MNEINLEELRNQLNEKTVSELKNVAKGFDIKFNSKVKKDELVELIINKHTSEDTYAQEDSNMEQTNEGYESQTVNIDINLLDDSPLNFFRPLNEKKYKEVMDSINTLGLLVPIIVRPKPNGRYEILAGHNRKNICQDLGWTEIPAIIRDVDDNEAQEIIADTNVAQRDDISPLEIAKAYGIKQEAIGRRQGQRTDIDGNHPKGRTIDIIGKEYEVSGMTVQRYLRLNNLIPEFKNALEDGVIKTGTAFELGLIDEGTQKSLLKIVDLDDKDEVKKINTKNVNKIKKALKSKNTLSKEEKLEAKITGVEPEIKSLSDVDIKELFSEERERQKDTIVKIIIPFDYDSHVVDFIKEHESKPDVLLGIVKDYLAQ